MLDIPNSSTAPSGAVSAGAALSASPKPAKITAVNVQQIDNGFIVTGWDPQKYTNIMVYCATSQGVQDKIDELFGVKIEPEDIPF